jgi:hypothetical protein
MLPLFLFGHMSDPKNNISDNKDCPKQGNLNEQRTKRINPIPDHLVWKKIIQNYRHNGGKKDLKNYKVVVFFQSNHLFFLDQLLIIQETHRSVNSIG